MSKPKPIDADHLICQSYEGEHPSAAGAFPEDTLAPVPCINQKSSEERLPDVTLSGGDIDATQSGLDTGEEAVGGSVPTPDQDIVDELGKAAGITYEDDEPLQFGDKIANRDARRWELNPASSEGYQDRLHELSGAGEAQTEPSIPTDRPTGARRLGKSVPRQRKRATAKPDKMPKKRR